ncbi:Pre-mRNA-splicing factor CWC22, partial [Tetrabaena socialis]
SSDEGDEEEEEQGGGGGGSGGIHDETATNLVNLRRTIYLTLMSSFDFEEAGHKLLKIGIQPGQEIELVTMVIECCSQERTFKRFYGLLAQRFCYLTRAYAEQF